MNTPKITSRTMNIQHSTCTRCGELYSELQNHTCDQPAVAPPPLPSERMPEYVEKALRRAERDDYATDTQKALKYLFDALDLAIAHDRQPYPTAEAYELACKARTRWQERAESAESQLSTLRAQAMENDEIVFASKPPSSVEIRLQGILTQIEHVMGDKPFDTYHEIAHALMVEVPHLIDEEKAELECELARARKNITDQKRIRVEERAIRDRLERELHYASTFIREQLDDDPCELDHHGNCQTHDWTGGECWQVRARRFLQTPAPVEAIQ